MSNWISSILGLGGLIQSQQIHNREIDLNNILTQRQINESIRQHNEQIENSNNIHNIEHEHSLESASREGLRDVWAQYNQKNQTSILYVTLLYSCCFVIIIEGEIPTNISKEILIIYISVISLKMISITLSLILLLKIQSKMTRYNIFNRHHVYDCGNQHPNFTSYYNHHCKKLKKYASLLSNFCLLLIYLSIIILWGSKIMIKFDSNQIMIVFILFNIIGLLIIILIMYKNL